MQVTYQNGQCIGHLHDVAELEKESASIKKFWYKLGAKERKGIEFLWGFD